MIFLFLLFGCMLFVLCSVVYWTLKNGISPMPVSYKVLKELKGHLPHSISGKIYDLGSGFGVLAFFLAKWYPKNPVIGIESSTVPYAISRIISLFSSATFMRKNFYTISLKDASLVVCYLFPGAMENIARKLEQDLSPKAWVISLTFAIPGWKAAKTVTVPDLYHSKIYIYKLDERH